MAMGGGTFTAQNKVLPGAYINFVSATTTALIGTRGIASLPLLLNWGEEGKIISIAAADFNRVSLALLGYAPTAPELLLVREALKRARILKLYRVNGGGAKASASIGTVTITALYSGARGNDITISCTKNIDDATKFDVTTYLAGQVMDTQTVANTAELRSNSYVVFGTDGELNASAGVPLTGGANGIVDGEKYSAYLTAIEVEPINVLGYPGTDNAIKSLFASFARRLRDDEGKKIVCVLANYAGDHEGIINVGNGVVLTDGTIMAADKAVAWVAGASAGAQVNESLTNANYDDAVDVDTKYTNTQYTDMIKAGKFVFYGNDGKASIVRDINSFTSFTPFKSADFASNRIIRGMDGVAIDTAYIFNRSYLGKVTNHVNGRALFKGDLIAMCRQYEKIDVITNFNPDDIVVEQGDLKRDVAVDQTLEFVDAMEKLYMTVIVR